jgi:hypothetical protein
MKAAGRVKSHRGSPRLVRVVSFFDWDSGACSLAKFRQPSNSRSSKARAEALAGA